MAIVVLMGHLNFLLINDAPLILQCAINDVIFCVVLLQTDGRCKGWFCIKVIRAVGKRLVKCKMLNTQL